MHRLLSFLLNHFMFAGTMFFAAGAAALGDLGGGGGAGAGDGAGDAGPADGGDGTGADGDAGGADGDAGVEGAGEPADGTTGDGQATDPNAPVDLGDGRSVPGKIKKLFDLAKTAGVEKEVKQLYFANQRLAKAIPGGVNGAIELAKSVEQLGGVEGIEALQSDIDTYHQDSELFERGDPKWVETAFQENPDAALKAFNHSLSYVSEHNPEHYDHVMAKVVLDTLDNGSPVGVIYNLLAGQKDNPQALKAAEQLARWYNTIKDIAAKAPEKKVDAQQKKLSDREAQVEQREMGTRYTQVNSAVFPVLKSHVTRTLEAEAKALGVDLKKLAADYPGAFTGMLNEIHRKVMEAAIKDQRFVDKYYALVKKGDLKRAEAAVNAKHEKIIPDIARAVAAASGLLKGKKTAAQPGADGKRPAAGNAGAADAGAAGWTHVSKAPERSTVNWHKTSAAMQLDGKYVLNDGKKVQVKY